MAFSYVLSSLVIFLLLFNSYPAAAEDLVLAKTGKYEFHESDFQRFLSYSPPYLKQQIVSNPEQKESLIRHLMLQKIISDLARKEGLDKKDDIKEQLQYLMDDFLSKVYVLQSIVEKVSVSEDEAKKYYDKNGKQFVVPEQIRVRHILIKVPFGAPGDAKTKAKNKAEQMLGWLKKGEKFETLAEHYSEDADSAKRGGDLGYLSKGRMSKSFEEAAFSLKPGQISGVVETDLGYHLIRVDDHKPSETKDFSVVKDAIVDQLKRELIQAKVEAFNKEVEEDAGLVVYSGKFSGK
jgi:peptidyl-prolyl cis-trans isomerase C